MAEYSYKKALTLLPADGQTTFGERLDEWKRDANSQQIVENFEREHFLPAEEMKRLMEFIVEKGIPVGDKQALRDELLYLYPKDDGLQLKGGEIKDSPKPKRIGFAIPKNEYGDFLSEEFSGIIVSDADIDDFLKKLIDENVERYPDCLFRKEKILLWVTWDKNGGDDPFSFRISNTCGEVQKALGLDATRYAQKVLLFFVNVDKLNSKLFRPTFCDADFGEYFRPTPIDFNDHGLTWPVGETYFEKEHPEKGQPEAVVRSKCLVLGAIEDMILLEN